MDTGYLHRVKKSQDGRGVCTIEIPTLFQVFSFCDLQKRSKALIVRSQRRSWPFFNPLMDTFIRCSSYTKCPLWKVQFIHSLKLNCSCLTNNNMGKNSDLQGKQFNWFLTSPMQLGKTKKARKLISIRHLSCYWDKYRVLETK